MSKFALYIDGFNFYNAVNNLNKPHLKWANLWRLAESIAKDHEDVVAVKYFSAYATWLKDSMQRHREYVKALESAGVEVTMAHFKSKTMTCRSCRASWESREEKETDVHLGLRFLADAEDGLFDRGALLSADSDLVPVVNLIKSRHKEKTIMVCAPPKRFGHGRHLQQVADQYIQIGPSKLEASLFPEHVLDEGGDIIATRPPQYAPT